MVIQQQPSFGYGLPAFQRSAASKSNTNVQQQQQQQPRLPRHRRRRQMNMPFPDQNFQQQQQQQPNLPFQQPPMQSPEQILPYQQQQQQQPNLPIQQPPMQSPEQILPYQQQQQPQVLPFQQQQQQLNPVLNPNYYQLPNYPTSAIFQDGQSYPTMDPNFFIHAQVSSGPTGNSMSNNSNARKNAH